MANGDAAAAAGLDTVAGTSDLRQGYDEINKTRDYLADHMTTGTHAATAINSGVLDAARIPNLPGTKITSAVASATAATSAGYATSAGSTVYANGPSGDAYSRPASGSGYFAVWMNSSLEFMRNTSSRRYKKNIRNWSGADAILRLRTVIFDRRGDDTPDDEVGFIAEEVLEHLPEAVVYFDDKIDGIVDRPIIAGLVSLCQAQQKQIDALIKKVGI